jgi:uncharacterized membrane protein
LLGDAHPHFLSLGAFPFFLLLASHVFKTPLGSIKGLTCVLTFISLPALFYLNANVWEAAVWISVSICILAVWSFGRITFPQQSKPANNMAAKFRDPRFKFPFFTLLVISMGASMLLMGMNFSGISSSIRWVNSDVGRTSWKFLLLHFGFFLIPLCLALGLELGKKKGAAYASLLLLSLLLFDSALAALITTLVFATWSKLQKVLAGQGPRTFSGSMSEGILLSSLVLLIVPEVIFLDDPYVGPHERMNTLFKLYYPIWFLLGYSAFYSIRVVSENKQFSLLRGKQAGLALWLLLAISSSNSFYIAMLRSSGGASSMRGLDYIDSQYPGAANIIYQLEQSLPGTVMEVVGSSYSDTGFVSTLAMKQSYLSWVGHLSLLYPDKRDEIQRRILVENRVYTEVDCQRRKQILKDEKVSYLVHGPLERKQYPEFDQYDSSCMVLMSQNDNFSLYKVADVNY